MRLGHDCSASSCQSCRNSPTSSKGPWVVEDCEILALFCDIEVGFEVLLNDVERRHDFELSGERLKG